MVYTTIDSITRELEQLNQSAKELGLYGGETFNRYNNQIKDVNKYYYGKKQVRELERIYKEFKVYETILIAKVATNKNEYIANGKEKK